MLAFITGRVNNISKASLDILSALSQPFHRSPCISVVNRSLPLPVPCLSEGKSISTDEAIRPENN